MSKHECEANYNYDEYGIAISQCREEKDGRFWVGNGEYNNEVAYCPFCGEKAKTPPKCKGINERFE